MWDPLQSDLSIQNRGRHHRLGGGSRARRAGSRGAAAGRFAGRDAGPRGGGGARHGVRGAAGRPAVAPHRRVRQDALLRGLRHRARRGLRGGERRLLQRSVRVPPPGHGARGRPRPAPRPPDAPRRRRADGDVQRRPRLRRAAARRGRRLLRAGRDPQQPAGSRDHAVADGGRAARGPAPGRASTPARCGRRSTPPSSRPRG